jgi:hypothetical protein
LPSRCPSYPDHEVTQKPKRVATLFIVAASHVSQRRRLCFGVGSGVAARSLSLGGVPAPVTAGSAASRFRSASPDESNRGGGVSAWSPIDIARIFGAIVFMPIFLPYTGAAGLRGADGSNVPGARDRMVVGRGRPPATWAVPGRPGADVVKMIDEWEANRKAKAA